MCSVLLSRRYGILSAVPAIAQKAGPAAWQNDLTPIAPADWNDDFAAHLLTGERLLGQFPIGLQHERDGFAKVFPGFLQCVALCVGPRQLLDESNIALGHLHVDRC